MKKFIFIFLALVSSPQIFGEEVMEKIDNGIYVVRTATLCSVKGYKSPTPLEVYINKKGVVTKVIALPNRETPKYFKQIKELFIPKLSGKKLKDIDKLDAVTGATMSSDAVKENVKVALEYFKKHK